MAWTADDIAQLRRHWSDGRTCKEIAILLGKTKNAVIGAARRNGLERRPSPLSDEGRWRYQSANQHQNTSPSAARPSRTAVASRPLASNPAHAGGDVASSGASLAPEGRGCGHGEASLTSPAGTPKPAGASSWVKSGKAAGGRRTARQSNRYYGIYGGKRGQHEAARQAAQDRAEGTCAACQQPEPLDATGLCGSCATLVTRADKPGAAWGAEPGNLNRRSGGTEADNVIVGEIGL